MLWYSGLEEICQPDAPLAELTWYRLGGPARWLFSPRTEDELAAVLSRCQSQQIPWRVLGHGANVLVGDGGVAGAVVRLRGPAWEWTAMDGPLVRAAAGADFPRLVKQAAERGLVGLENLAGIPGSVGGIVRMNAGGKYGSVSQYVRQVRVMQADGTIRLTSSAEMGFRYRGCDLLGSRDRQGASVVVLEAQFELARGDPKETLERYRQIWNEKHASQPPVAARSAGCIFKNPPGYAAGKLLDDAGLKGTRRGAAEISQRHANFIVAYAGAKAQDIVDLIELGRARVREKFGVELELEVEIW